MENNDNTQYRFINWDGIHILKDDLPQVEATLQKSGWTTNPTATYDKTYLIAPRTEPYVHTDNYEVLRAVAPYILVPGWIILERMTLQPFKKEWVHVFFDAKGGCTEYVTPQGQWKVS